MFLALAENISVDDEGLRISPLRVLCYHGKSFFGLGVIVPCTGDH